MSSLSSLSGAKMMMMGVNCEWLLLYLIDGPYWPLSDEIEDVLVHIKLRQLLSGVSFLYCHPVINTHKTFIITVV